MMFWFINSKIGALLGIGAWLFVGFVISFIIAFIVDAFSGPRWLVKVLAVAGLWGFVTFIVATYNSTLTRPGSLGTILTESYDEYATRKKRDEPPVRTNISTEVRRFELVSWNPPKHFYVTLEDVQSQQVWKSVYVSKHCNASGSLKRGDEYNLSVTHYSLSNRPGETFFEFNGLYNAFCGS